ncbi:Ku protein [Brevibacillus sp. SYP-B805]|uniref:non-homologous end joining protein Ku n=1 Tax=Brevibacillus sp. SYP-B805 TaxID=1578199 RepID=UPI0013ED53A9|nr:Ku protein [Brevibacillus sp. SYP-B805]NGQ93873.1 Ku protein [Brevibacillus sp. SYP-B805]
MHTVWKGSISFGLVNIPVRMFTATEERDIRFRQLHKACNTPIRYAKMCPHCDREVEASEIVRGFEYEKGNFVIIQDEELESIAPETRRAIEILDFVDLSEIDPVYFDKSYYLAPQETGEKAYALLRAAMHETGKIAIARITMRNRQSLAAVRIHENCIMLATLYYPDEVRSVSLVPDLPAETLKLTENERKMAEELISRMSSPFDPAKYTDRYRADLQELIERKLEGKEVAVSPAAPRANVIDLMQALKESLAATSAEVGVPVKAEPERTPAVSTAVEPETEEKAATRTTTRKLKRKKAE